MSHWWTDKRHTEEEILVSCVDIVNYGCQRDRSYCCNDGGSFFSNFRKKKKENIDISIIGRVLPICIVFLRVCLIGSLPALYRQSAPRAHLGIAVLPGVSARNSRYTRRLTAIEKKGEKKKKMAINRFRRLQIEMSCMPVPRRQVTPSEPTLTWISVASSSFAIFFIFLFIYFFYFLQRYLLEERSLTCAFNGWPSSSMRVEWNWFGKQLKRLRDDQVQNREQHVRLQQRIDFWLFDKSTRLLIDLWLFSLQGNINILHNILLNINVLHLSKYT